MRKIYIAFLLLLGVVSAFGVRHIWHRDELEIQVRETKESPDKRWTAVVQMEVYSAPAFVSDAVYAVRLVGPSQKEKFGDLVMNVSVNYPDPSPSIDWRNGSLIVTLPQGQAYQYFSTSVSGVPVLLHRQ